MSEIEIRDRIEKERRDLEAWLIVVEKDLAFRKGKIQALEELLPPPTGSQKHGRGGVARSSPGGQRLRF